MFKSNVMKTSGGRYHGRQKMKAKTTLSISVSHTKNVAALTYLPNVFFLCVLARGT